MGPTENLSCPGALAAWAPAVVLGAGWALLQCLPAAALRVVWAPPASSLLVPSAGTSQHSVLGPGWWGEAELACAEWPSVERPSCGCPTGVASLKSKTWVCCQQEGLFAQVVKGPCAAHLPPLHGSLCEGLLSRTIKTCDSGCCPVIVPLCGHSPLRFLCPDTSAPWLGQWQGSGVWLPAGMPGTGRWVSCSCAWAQGFPPFHIHCLRALSLRRVLEPLPHSLLTGKNLAAGLG